MDEVIRSINTKVAKSLGYHVEKLSGEENMYLGNDPDDDFHGTFIEYVLFDGEGRRRSYPLYGHCFQSEEECWKDAQELPNFASDLNVILPVCKQLKDFSLSWDYWNGGLWEAICEKPSDYEYGECWSVQGDDPAVVCCELWLMVKGNTDALS